MINRSNMFTKSCLIRKNTKELRDKLVKFGHKVPKLTETEGRKYGILCNGKVAIGIPKDCYEFNLDKYLKDNPHIVDCGTNKDLFIAIAALRNDTDKNQWFTDGDNWVLCEDIKFSSYWVYNNIDVNLDTIHKATSKELIKHFKDK